MALQKCPECAGQLSDRASECPHCGWPQGLAASSRAVEWLKSVPLAIGVLTLIFGVVQYKRAQDWNRAEFVAAEMQDFESKLEVRQAMRIVLWDGRSVRLFPERLPGQDSVVVTDEMLGSALRPPDSTPGATAYSDDLAQISDYFDVFFDGLERFGHFAEAGLVDKIDLEPYLDRWISVLGDTSREKPRILRTYVHCSGYSGVEHLIDLWGSQPTTSIPCP